MKVPFQNGSKEKEHEVELYVLGNSFCVDDKRKMLRIGPLSKSQWKLIAELATTKAQ